MFGERIEDPSREQYGGRKIAVRWDGTSVDKGQTSNSSPVTRDGDTVSTGGTEFNADETEASVTFDATLDSEDVTLTLVSYTATCPPRFGGGGTAYLQDLHDDRTVTYEGDPTAETLTVTLPGLNELGELCEL